MRTLEVDCHCYPWHLNDPNYPECGPDNLKRFAEVYDVTVTFMPDHPLAGWAWWYEVTGKDEDLYWFLSEEYGDVEPLPWPWEEVTK